MAQRIVIRVQDADAQECPMSMSGTRSPCLGARCMAWRFTMQRQLLVHKCEDFDAVEELPRPAHVPASYEWHADEIEGAGWVEPEIEAESRRQGYCGMVP